MKAFADHFGEEFTAPLPPLSGEQAAEVAARPRLLGVHRLQNLEHQRAVKNAMKKDQEDLKADMQKPQNANDFTAMLAALENPATTRRSRSSLHPPTLA